MRERLTISVGCAGIQLAQTIWRQYCAEHDIDTEGNIADDTNRSLLRFYEETESGKFIPRNLMVDLEANVIDNVIDSKYSKIFDTEFLVSGKEDAANNFARGHYSVGKELIGKVNDRLRKLVDKCDNLQGFVMNNAVGGGTGSGLAALILERIAVDYRKKSKLGFHIYPFNNRYSTGQVEAYNALLATHWLLDHTEWSFVFDNRKVYDICNGKLYVPTPSYDDLNSIISKVVCACTAGMRFESELNRDLNEIRCEFPRLHFLTTSIAPIINKQTFMQNKRKLVDGFVRSSFNDRISEHLYDGLLYKDLMNIIYSVYDVGCPKFTVYDIAKQAFDADNFMVECLDFDAERDKYMTISTYFRGNVERDKANIALKQLTVGKKVTFVEWSPTWFGIGLHEHKAVISDTDCMGVPESSAVAIGNNTLMSRFFRERILKSYDLMYSQRAFVHWYVAEGMAEGEFAEARENLGFLEKDYLDVLREEPTDCTWTDESDNDDSD